MTHSKIIGYCVVDQKNDVLISKDNIKSNNEERAKREYLFDSKNSAEDLIDDHESDRLEIAAVSDPKFKIPKKILEGGEIIEYKQHEKKVVAYVRSGRDVYAVTYTLDSYSKLDNYTPFQ